MYLGKDEAQLIDLSDLRRKPPVVPIWKVLRTYAVTIIALAVVAFFTRAVFLPVIVFLYDKTSLFQFMSF